MENAKWNKLATRPLDDDDKINEMYKKHGVTCYKPNITNIV